MSKVEEQGYLDEFSRLMEVMSRVQSHVSKNPDCAIDYLCKIDTILEELREDDMFGTEGQLDPRGDGHSTIGYVDVWHMVGYD